MLKTDIFENYPKPDRAITAELLKKEMQEGQLKIIALDDDPTGVQTVHDVSVYTDWEEESIRRGFAEEKNLFFILTNSRSFTEEQTTIVHREIAGNIEKAAEGRPYLLISRGDSTLRGHYPLETEILRGEIEKHHDWKFDGEILCPYFAEGGRFTIGNVHYVKYGEDLVPAAETEFAKDKTFGYSSSDLTKYVEEKSHGRYPAEEVICISLEDLRAMNLEKIESQLLEAHDFQKIIVNAIDHIDVEIFSIALYRALKKDRHYLYRTAAAFVKAAAAVSDKPLLTKKELAGAGTTGGVIVIGSHTEKTTKQLEALKKRTDICFMELNSDLVLEEGKLEQEAAEMVKKIEACIQKGETAAVYTRRKLLAIEGDTKEAALLRSVKISEAVQSLVGNLTVKPAFVIAKGGITSSDVGVKALQVKHAEVMGQISPGIPVWKTGDESRFPGIPYVIFPGNVGQENTLYEVVSVFMD